MQTDNRKSLREGTLFSLISATFKGISQVILLENTISGLIILIAIMLSSVSIGVVVLLSSFIGALIGRVGGADKNIVNQGLLSYNSVLVGIALPLYLEGGMRWIFAIAGAAVAALFTASMMHVMRNSKVPVLSFPYIVLTWFLLLASYRLGAFHLSPTLLPQHLPQRQLHSSGTTDWIHGLVGGIGQVYFHANVWAGILILIGVFWAGWRLGVYAVLGTIVAWLVAYGLGAEVSLLNSGLYGYNAVVTILAIATVFDAKSRFAPWAGILAAVLTIPVTASLNTWLLPYGLPTLSMPFVLCTWLFLAARKVLPKI